jgi:cadmium resistance protein CadD (predicted permease)
MKNKLYSLMPIALGISLLFLANLAHAEAQIKEVCKDRKDKAGKVVMDKKTNKSAQDCKKIKVHKKLEGTRVPEKK